MKKYRTALILGRGRSGQAAERLLRAEGCAATVLAEEGCDQKKLFQTLENQPFEVCIASPGFAFSHPWMEAVRAAGIPLLPELELGWSRHRGKTVAVTGSNGKSTAVKWICDMLRRSGRSAAIGGNYGIPACEVVLEDPDRDWLVLEASSFQLETVRDFRPEVAVLLNVLPNHLDRHGSMQAYRRIKERIFFPISKCIAPFGQVPEMEREWITFGSDPAAGFFFRNGRVFQGLEAVADLSGTLFDSPILGSCTGAAGIAVAAACGIGFGAAEEAAQSFEPLPHRLEKLGEWAGVTYVNDSKATNLAAMAAALEACAPGIHLIAGGLPKETDFTFVEEILAERAASIYLIGQVSRTMYRAWNAICRCVECGTLEKAFETARNAARPGATVLLSPGCASFDQFRSFEERGTCFTALFQELAHRNAAS